MAKVLEFNTADLSYPSQLINNGRDQLIYKILGCSEHVALAGIQDSTVPNLWVAGLRCHSSVDTGTASGTPSGVNAENVGVLPASGTNTYVAQPVPQSGWWMCKDTKRAKSVSLVQNGRQLKVFARLPSPIVVNIKSKKKKKSRLSEPVVSDPSLTKSGVYWSWSNNSASFENQLSEEASDVSKARKVWEISEKTSRARLNK